MTQVIRKHVGSSPADDPAVFFQYSINLTQ